MKELPHSIINYIFTFIFKPYEMRLFSDINLELKDVNLLEKKCKHQINILKEYMAKTKFWRIKWLNKDFDIGTSDDEYDTDIDFTKYESSRESLLFLTEYWNYHYYPRFDAFQELKNHNNCEEEYITDYNKANYHIFKRLKLLKDYIWSDKHNNLFKPGIKNRIKPIWKSNCLVMEGDL